MSVFAVISNSFRLTVRGRYLYFVFAILVFMAGATLMAAAFSARQPATVALDVGISVFRFCIPIFAAVVVQGLVAHEFERRYFLASMTYPHSRTVWLVGRYLTVILLVAAVLLVHALILRELVEMIGRGYSQATKTALGQQYWWVVGFAFVDFVVITSVALLIAVFATTPGLVVFGAIGFLLIARSYSSILALLDGATGLVTNEKTYREGIGLLHYLVPDLGALDIRATALYGRMDFLPAIWPQQVTGALLYILATTALAIWLFQRKRFV
ncbi:MAG: hypothetical protein KJ787_12015 [Gammaproteobacteria bacterium]|nr:hypothetical protein [Gammaproteobacteria bacterium]MBU1647048.1 hypothetical protein [Gammaproteobacteria bacterium]MBU1972560.1 hypothetical protein [Gammaproteobacteria bacterium]